MQSRRRWNAHISACSPFFTAKVAGEDRLLERVAEKVNGFLKLAEGSGVTLIHENEKRIYGDTPEKALALYNALNHPGFALCYDASNYIQCGVDSWEAHRQTKRYTVYYHMKDCAEGIEVPLGTGEGRIPELLADLNASGYGGFLTLEATHAAICAAEKGVPPAPLCHQHQKGACVPAN